MLRYHCCRESRQDITRVALIILGAAEKLVLGRPLTGGRLEKPCYSTRWKYVRGVQGYPIFVSYVQKGRSSGSIPLFLYVWISQFYQNKRKIFPISIDKTFLIWYNIDTICEVSSAGRALAPHARGRRFEPVTSHQGTSHINKISVIPA